jgi:hypothetical protein
MTQLRRDVILEISARLEAAPLFASDRLVARYADMTIRFSLTDPIALGRYQKAPIYLHPTFFN